MKISISKPVMKCCSFFSFIMVLGRFFCFRTWLWRSRGTSVPASSWFLHTRNALYTNASRNSAVISHTWLPFNPTQFSAKLWENNQTINWILVTNTTARNSSVLKQRKSPHPCQLGSLRIILHTSPARSSRISQNAFLPPPPSGPHLQNPPSDSLPFFPASTPLLIHFSVCQGECAGERVCECCVSNGSLVYAFTQLSSPAVARSRFLPALPSPTIRAAAAVNVYHLLACTMRSKKTSPSCNHSLHIFFPRCIYPTACPCSIVFEFVK